MSNESIFEQEFPTLETPRFLLRKTSLNDAEDIYLVFSDEEVMKYIPLDRFTTIEDANSEIRWHHDIYNKKTGIRFGIEDKETKRIIGTCGFLDYEKKDNRAEMGYDLASSYWRKGIMTEVASEVLTFAFQQLKLNRVEARIDEPNEASRNLLLRLGFQKEGLLREFSYSEDGYVNVEVYSLLKKDYK